MSLAISIRLHRLGRCLTLWSPPLMLQFLPVHLGLVVPFESPGLRFSGCFDL